MTSTHIDDIHDRYIAAGAPELPGDLRYRICTRTETKWFGLKTTKAAVHIQVVRPHEGSSVSPRAELVAEVIAHPTADITGLPTTSVTHSTQIELAMEAANLAAGGVEGVVARTVHDVVTV